jgi:hypothetical protein
MQCHLEVDELNLLADVLLEQISTMSDRPSSDSSLKPDSDREKDRRAYNALLDRVLARDQRLDADEFELAAQLLAVKKRLLKDQIASQTNPAQKRELQQKLTVLERALEKISEACVMF